MHENTKESFVSITPRHAQLKGLIAYYYFHQTFDPDGVHQVIYYPHYLDVVNCYQNAEVSLNSKGRIIRSSKQNSIASYYTSNPYRSRMVRMHGINNKIGIVFKPLGFNHFIPDYLQHHIKDIVTPFTAFGTAFVELAETLYQKHSLEYKRDSLDHFFVNRLMGFKDQTFKSLLNSILEVDPSMTLNTMASWLNVSPKTVHRKFKRHIGHSPSTFKAVVKFRSALHQHQTLQKRIKPSLAEIGADSAYYDQSDFIKQYKSLVGLTPKQLFSRIQTFGENQTFWTYID